MEFQTRSFLMPNTEDGQLLHQAVIAALSEGQNISEPEKQFCYKVTRSHKIAPLQLVEVKGFELPAQSQPLTDSISLTEGEFINLTVDLSMSRTINLSPKGEPTKRTDIFISPHDTSKFESMLSSLLMKNGMELVRVNEVGQLFKTGVAKANHKFFIPHCEISLTATIIDPLKAERCFVTGFGKHKAYGYGMIQINERF
jgi:hypothetical protein